jgi:DNA-binding response OmpR family regulator
MARILIVDDDPLLRELLQMHLNRHGHSAVLAGDAQQAFQALLKREFDLILSDIEMPHIDGLKMLKCIRADERTRGIPVIVMSALKDADTMQLAARLGVANYLVKPVSGRGVVAAVEAALERAAGERVPFVAAAGMAAAQRA